MGNKRIVSLLVLFLLGLAASGWLDRNGEHYGAEAFQRALITAAAARALNGVISVAQGTDVAIEPGGVGVNFGVGQILDPVNDLVERFSAIMLVATTSLGVQNILLDVSAWWWTSVVLLIFAIPVLAGWWWPGLISARWQQRAERLLILMVFTRFAVPVFVIVSNLAFATFLEQEQTAALVALESTAERVETLNEENRPQTDEDESLLDRLGNAIDDSLAAVNVSDRIARFKEAMRGASDHVINLIIIFVVQTILLPLVFVQLLLAGFKLLLRQTAAAPGE